MSSCCWIRIWLLFDSNNPRSCNRTFPIFPQLCESFPGIHHLTLIHERSVSIHVLQMSKILKSFWQVQSRESEAYHPPWKDYQATPAFVFRIQQKYIAIISFLVIYLFIYVFFVNTFTCFSKVNRRQTQGDIFSLPTTGNKCVCRACASQIKRALFRMIYGCDAVLGALGCELTRFGRWRGSR